MDCKLSRGLQAGPNRTPVTLAVADDVPIHAGIRQDSRKITLEFTPEKGTTNLYDVGYVLMQALALVGPKGAKKRTLVMERTDGPDITDQLETEVTVGQYRYGDARNSVLVELWAADDRWFRSLPTILPQVSFTAPVAIPILNHGGADANLTIKLGYTVQRTTESQLVGWKWQRIIGPIVNNGSNPWNRVRFTVDMGDTAALVPTKAQADGDDVRIWINGRIYPCTKTNWNTKRTWVHFWASVPAGETLTPLLVYGNPDAPEGFDISTKQSHKDTYAADDLEGDSGTASAGTTGTLTDATKSWEVDRWAGGFLGIVSGTQSVRWRRIESNTATVITLNRVLAAAIDNTSVYVIWKSGVFVDGGRVTARTSTTVTDNLHTGKWTPSSLKGATINFLSGTTAVPAKMTVEDNTDEVITFTSAFSTNPTVGDNFTIERWGVLNYMVDKDIDDSLHRGLWRSSRYIKGGGEITFGDRTPGGWMRMLMVDNNDNFNQLSVTNENTPGSPNLWPILDATRMVHSDRELQEKGQYDGVFLYEPRGMVAFYWNYRYENDHAIGTVVVKTQGGGGDNWQTVISDGTTHGSEVAVTSGEAAGKFALDDEPIRLYVGVEPTSSTGEILSNESHNRRARLKCHNRWIVYLSLTDCGGMTDSLWTVGAETAFYDEHTEGRIGGGEPGDEVPPYQTFELGGIDDDDGEHWTALTSGQRLWINGAPSPAAPLFGIYNSSDVLVSRAPLAGIIEDHELDLDGVDTPTVVHGILPLRPANNMIANEDDMANWTKTDGVGVTSVMSNEDTIVWDGDESIEVAASVTPAGAWTITLEYPRIPVIPGTHYEFGFLRKKSGFAGGVSVQMKIDWEYADGLMSAAEGTTTIGSTTTTTWAPDGSGHTAHIGSALTEPTTQAFVYIIISGTGSMTGSIFLDAIHLGGVNLYLDEAEMGTRTVDVEWRESFFA